MEAGFDGNEGIFLIRFSPPVFGEEFLYDSPTKLSQNKSILRDRRRVW